MALYSNFARRLSRRLISPAGAALVRFTHDAVDAISCLLSDLLSDHLTIRRFGATTESADITGALNAAVKHCAARGGGVIDFPYSGTFNLLGTVYLLPKVTINLNACKLVGSGDNTMFETGYVNEHGAVLTNIGTPPESRLVINSKVNGGTLRECGVGFNLYNFIDGCGLFGTRFERCDKAVMAARSWYACFERLTARDDEAAVSDAYTFHDFANVMGIRSCFAEGYDRGFVISGGADGQKLQSCSAEGCRVAVVVIGETSTLEFDTFYCEANTEMGFDLNTAGLKKIRFRNCWFLGLPIGINGGQGMHCDIDASNTWKQVDVRYKVNDVNTDFTRFEDPATAIFAGNIPAAPGLTLDQRGHFEQEVGFFDSASGAILAKTNARNGGLVPFEFGGRAGASVGRVPFAVTTKKDDGTLRVVTSIVDSDMQIVAFRLVVSDEIATHTMYGLIFGSTIVRYDGTGKTITRAVVGGKLTLDIGSLSIPGAGFGCEGVIRHV